MVSFEDKQERHRRRLVLMRAQGNINRREGHVFIAWGTVAVCLVIIAVLACLT